MKWHPAQRDRPATHGSACAPSTVVRVVQYPRQRGRLRIGGSLGRRLRAWFAWHRRAAGDDRPEGDGSRSAGRWQMAELESCYTWPFPPVLPCSSEGSHVGRARCHVFGIANTRNQACFYRRFFYHALSPWPTRTTGPGLKLAGAHGASSPPLRGGAVRAPAVVRCDSTRNHSPGHATVIS